MKFLRIPTERERRSFFEEYRATRQPGTYLRAYAAAMRNGQTGDQVAVQKPPQAEQKLPRQKQDISEGNTMLLPSVQQQHQSQGQQIIHDSSEFDIRVISLPSILDRLITNHEARYGKYPDEIHLRPDSIEILKAWGLTTGDNVKKRLIYKGIFTLIPDKTLSCVSIVLDSYKYAL